MGEALEVGHTTGVSVQHIESASLGHHFRTQSPLSPHIFRLIVFYVCFSRRGSGNRVGIRKHLMILF